MNHDKDYVLKSVDIPLIVSRLLPNGRKRGDEWEARCPFHEDQNPSFGINLETGLWKCFGCGESGSIFDLYGRINGLSFSESVQALGEDFSCHPGQDGNHTKKSEERPAPSIPESVVEGLVKKMTPKAYQWLTEHRGVSEETAKHYKIGLWERNGQKRFAIPVRDDKVRIVNIRLWLPPVGIYVDPAKRKGAGKMKSWPDGMKGRGKVRLFPSDQLKTPSLVLCEGEMDALALISHGIATITVTGGARTWQDEWNGLSQGKTVTFAYDNDADGQEGAKKAAESLIKAGAKVKAVSWPKGRPKGHDVTDEVLKNVKSLKKLLAEAPEWRAEKSDDQIKIDLVCLSDVKPEKVEWLWDGYIPIGKITLLDGDPGLGKSMLTLDLAARLSRGVSMPDGTPCTQGSTVLMTLEDGLADTISPRLNAAGADASKISAFQGIAVKKGESRMPTLGDIEAIGRAIKKVGAKLVIIDPLMAYLPGGTNSHNDQEVRQTLAPLSLLAEEHQVAVIVIRHLNKSGGSQSIYRGGGSIGIIGAARCGLLVGKDPDDENKMVLAGIKSNLGKLPDSLSFHIEGANGAARIVWRGISNHSADKLLAVSHSKEERSALDEAKEFLIDLLSNGVVGVKQIKKDAREAGIFEKTLYRAKTALSIKADKAGFSGGWIWTLPQEEIPEGGQESSKMVIQKDDHLREENPSNVGENGSQVIDISQDCQESSKMAKGQAHKELDHLGEDDKNPTFSSLSHNEMEEVLDVPNKGASGGNNIKRVKI